MKLKLTKTKNLCKPVPQWGFLRLRHK